MTAPTALITGATGLVGGLILSTLRAGAPSPYTSIEVLARRALPAAPNAPVPVKEFTDTDLSKWVPHLSSLSPAPSTYFSSLATTRAAAGSFEKQYELEHDLNVELAKAAKKAGTKIYVLISASGANTHSRFGYVRMKGEIEEHVKDQDFDHTIILRPGLIAGNRAESRPTEAVLRHVAWALGHIHSGLKDFWAQEADTIAKAAILTAIKAERGEIKDKVIVLGQSDIVRVGEKEWNAFAK